MSEESTRSGTSRRTLVRGAAWTVPAVVVAAAAPAASASPVCVSVTYAAGSCKNPGSGNDWSYCLGFCFTNSCTTGSGPSINIVVTGIQNNAGKPLAGPYPSLTIGPGATVCSSVSYYTSSSSASKVQIFYTLNGVAQPYIEIPAPPDCDVSNPTCAPPGARVQQRSAAQSTPTETSAPTTEVPAPTETTTEVPAPTTDTATTTN